MGYLKLAICLVCVAMLSLGQAMVMMGADHDERIIARSAGETTDPVAIIEPLPDMISNGTRYYLDGLASFDLEDDLVNMTQILANYTWELTHENETLYLYGARNSYRFQDMGLYKIKLIVRDSWGNTGENFTAVMSVDDVDCDGMPDWWELYYLGTIDGDPTADFDSDGYTNIHEWVEGTFPNVVDPPPPSGGFLEENWAYVLVAAAAVAGAMAAMYLVTRMKRKEREAKKLEIALELEKSLDEE